MLRVNNWCSQSGWDADLSRLLRSCKVRIRIRILVQESLREFLFLKFFVILATAENYLNPTSLHGGRWGGWLTPLTGMYPNLREILSQTDERNQETRTSSAESLLGFSPHKHSGRSYDQKKLSQARIWLNSFLFLEKTDLFWFLIVRHDWMLGLDSFICPVRP